MILPRVFAWAGLSASLFVSAACSLALQTPEAQCTTDAECDARGGEFAGTVCIDQVCQTKPEPADPKWGCIGNVEPAKPGGMDTIKLQMFDIISAKPAKGLSIKLCNKYDPMCAAPIGMPEADAEGWVSATVPSDVETYFEVTTADDSYMPALVFMDHVAASKNTDIQLVPPSIAEGLAVTAGVTLDPAAGIVLTRTTDCQHERTAGVSTTIFPSDKETSFYVINSSVSPNATKTDSAGNAGFVNVTPGNPAITGTVGPEGPVLGKVTTLVRAGHITFQVLRPTATL
jgi:cytochrome c5